MRFNPFGHRLHGQIIWPLMVASIGVAIIAAVAAQMVVGGIVDQWADHAAESSAAFLESRVGRRVVDAHRNLRLLTGDEHIQAVIEGGDADAIRQELLIANRTLGAGALALLDDAGRVTVSTGALELRPGEQPFGVRGTDWGVLSQGQPLLARSPAGSALATVVPVSGPSGAPMHLALFNLVNDAYAGALDADLDAGLVFLDSDGGVVASSMPGRPGERALVEAVESVIADIDAGSLPISEAINGVTVRIDGREHRLYSRTLRFANETDGGVAYIVSVMDSSAAAVAKRSTTGMIVGWTIVAVAVLFGFNWWVARAVSRPLFELSDSVGRVAAGDYEVYVPPAGATEVVALAENFNRMTESLRDRSDSLTKKVLELATLYEMSRALSGTLEPDTLYTAVLDSAIRIFDVEIGYITMLDRDAGSLEVRAWRGVDLSRADGHSLRNSMAEWVVREGRPLIFNPPSDGVVEREDTLSGALAALCVPLLGTEGALGAITVGSRNSDQRFTSDDVRLLSTIANHVTVAIGNISLFSSVQEAYLATVRALAAAVDAKDPYTRGHSDGVAAYALEIGEALGLSPEQMVSLEMAAYLHDIGKIGISEEILLKPGKLTPAEMGQMRHHPLIGANILKPVAFPWPIAPIVRHHHEHFDGRGYPAGLRNEEIPVLARILTVADAYEAMVADRPYRRGRSQQEAILELRRCAGTQFDPHVVEAFVRVLENRQDDGALLLEGDAELGPEETQAILVAVCDGMFGNFRRLGGPRLANNLERAVNAQFAEEGVPLSFVSGRIVISPSAGVEDGLVAHLRHAVDVISARIEDASGAGLADHFLGEAVGALPERMRAHAGRLGLVPTA
jgi:putative nucleotidyltransferase with HDIG domain